MISFILHYSGDNPFICIAFRYTKGETNTADAIRYARETAFTPQNGMRPIAAHIAIIVTDGKNMTISVFEKPFYFIHKL